MVPSDLMSPTLAENGSINEVGRSRHPSKFAVAAQKTTPVMVLVALPIRCGQVAVYVKSSETKDLNSRLRAATIRKEASEA